MQTAHDLVRSKVDALRSAVTAGEVNQGQAIEALAGVAACESSVDHSISNPDMHRGGALHMCPWHTCQATRHINS